MKIKLLNSMFLFLCVLGFLFAMPAFSQELEMLDGVEPEPEIETINESEPTGEAELMEPEGAEVVSEVILEQAIIPENGANYSIAQKAQLQAAGFDLRQLTPILFLQDEHDLILEAKRLSVNRPPTVEEVEEEQEEVQKPIVERVIEPGRRELSLSGIVFRSSKDWTIWFNEQRVQPNAIPKEVLDLRVHKDYVDIKWFDEYTNQIFPIRLRPHQRFNLDARLFLPG